MGEEVILLIAPHQIRFHRRALNGISCGANNEIEILNFALPATTIRFLVPFPLHPGKHQFVALLTLDSPQQSFTLLPRLLQMKLHGDEFFQEQIVWSG